MFCRNCGKELAAQAVACTQCGVPPMKGAKFCHSCGKETNEAAVVCVACGVALGAPQGAGRGAAIPGAEKKLPVAICGILLGALGVHKFVLGYTMEGLIMLLVTLLTCGMGGAVMGIIGLVEGILYLTKSDEDFVRTYIENKKGWF